MLSQGCRSETGRPQPGAPGEGASERGKSAASRTLGPARLSQDGMCSDVAPFRRRGKPTRRGDPAGTAAPACDAGARDQRNRALERRVGVGSGHKNFLLIFLEPFFFKLRRRPHVCLTLSLCKAPTSRATRGSSHNSAMPSRLLAECKGDASACGRWNT